MMDKLREPRVFSLESKRESQDPSEYDVSEGTNTI